MEPLIFPCNNCPFTIIHKVCIINFVGVSSVRPNTTLNCMNQHGLELFHLLFKPMKSLLHCGTVTVKKADVYHNLKSEIKIFPTEIAVISMM